MDPLTLDHVVIAVRDLDAATANYQRLFGRRPSWQGRHPEYGTANTLFRLDNTYIELLGPGNDPAADLPGLRALQQRLETGGEGLTVLALGTNDIDATVARARAHGLDMPDPADGSGVDRATGATRRWRSTRLDPASTRGVPLYLIQHLSPPEALPPAAAIGDERAAVHAVDHTVIASSHLDASLALWKDVLGLDLRRSVPGPNNRMLHLLLIGPPGAMTSSILELAGETRPERPGKRDLLYGIAYRAPDVAALVGRLRAEQATVSDARPGRADQTFVADLKPGFSHDVRTLFIQKDVK
jgi:catechol 2,3-dioxygenase-like lactoylglutathione lyase family enzyme